MYTLIIYMSSIDMYSTRYIQYWVARILGTTILLCIYIYIVAYRCDIGMYTNRITNS